MIVLIFKLLNNYLVSMIAKNYNSFCNICRHKSFEAKRGIVCLKTNKKPDFEENCSLFEETDSSLAARKYIAAHPVDPDRQTIHKGSPDSFNRIVLGMALLSLGIFILVVSANEGKIFIARGIFVDGISRLVIPSSK